jgi:preprotein translocase subunit SecG
MTTIILIVHLLIALALVGVILLQRSEGGALGIGGGGMGLMSGRASANLLTRVTAGLAAAFIITSLLLAILAAHRTAPRSILDQPTMPAGPAVPADTAPPPPSEPVQPAVPAEPAAPSAPVAD